MLDCFVLSRKMNYFLKLIIITLIILNSQIVNSEVYKISNTEIQNLIDEGVPIIDIRREEEWVSTGIIKHSHLLTFFDKNGNYNLENWMSEFEKIVEVNKPFILICRTGRRTNIIANYLSKETNYNFVYDADGGIISWMASGNNTVSPK